MLARTSSTILIALLLALLVLLPGWAMAGSGSPPGGHRKAPLAIGGGAVRRPAAGWTASRIYYASSVDGFNLSYQEVLPAGFIPTATYPLAVELHGIALNESVAKPGGYTGSVDNNTANASSSVGFILLDPASRTGDGYYVDSANTGPQAQDVLDAIVHEQSLRHIGPVYLYGFSMGAMGAMEIGLAHPQLFAGLGAIATESDIYELENYSESIHSGGVVSALLNASSGYPNSSATAQQVWDSLSVLRQDPAATRGLRMYFTAGGRDVAIPNNAVYWPYLQANDSLLVRSCLYVPSFHEPTGCTTPLAELAAIDPVNYSFRFVYEENAPHNDAQANATDLFDYFAGQVGPGLYQGTFPDPTPAPPATPLVTLATSPIGCGSLTFSGSAASTGSTIPVAPGTYGIGIAACTGARLTGEVTRGGVSYNAAAGTITVRSSGAFVAEFTQDTATVQFGASTGCPFGTVNGTVVPVPSLSNLALGSYALAAGTCSGEVFSSWNTGGGVQVASTTSATTTMTVAANGSIIAQYSAARPPPGAVNVTVLVTPAACGPVALNGSLAASGTVVALLPGRYALLAGACAGFSFQGWQLTGGLSLTGSGPGATLNVTADGSATATYAPTSPADFSVEFLVRPADCLGAVQVDGVTYSNGTTGRLSSGPHTLGAGSCSGFLFSAWSSSGGASIAGPTLTVTANGSVTAAFVPNLGGNPGGSGSNSSATPSLSNLEWAAVGGLMGAAATALVFLAMRRRRPRSPVE